MNVGSAFLHLSCRLPHRSVGWFPLLLQECDSLADSRICASVTITSVEAPILGEDEEETLGAMQQKLHRQPQFLAHQFTVPVQLLVEQAVRLHSRPLLVGSLAATPPSQLCYYVTVDAVECDDITVARHFVSSLVPASARVTWSWEQQVRLDKEMLRGPDRTLQFKIWQQNSAAGALHTDVLTQPQQQQQPADRLPLDQLLGVADVDLTPLTNGLHQLLGWYNVTHDEAVVGQIKLGVTPLL